MKTKGEHFLREVTNHIKSKEAKEFVATELEFHLKQARNTWIAKGFNEESAEKKAVEQMGSPIKLGQELNRLHRPLVDWWMVVLLILTMGIGFLPLLSFENTDMMDLRHTLMNKMIFVILGFVAAFGMMMIDYRKLEKGGWLFYITGVLILFMLKILPVPIITIINGEPLLNVGPFTIECIMAVPFFLLAWASFFNNGRAKIWQLGILFLFSLYLFLMIPNPSVTFLYIIMVFMMLWWSSLGKKKALLITIGTVCLSIISGGLLYFQSSINEYQLSRILGFLNPENDATGTGYMYLHLKDLLSSAGWFGTSGKEDFFQAGHTDFVFASLTYYYGYLFAIVLVLILFSFVARMMVISYKVNNHYAKLLVIGGITLFGVQFLYNVAMMLGFLPITSISLPFISYGLMPTLFNGFLMGIVLSVYRRKNLVSSSFR